MSSSLFTRWLLVVPPFLVHGPGVGGLVYEPSKNGVGLLARFYAVQASVFRVTARVTGGEAPTAHERLTFYLAGRARAGNLAGAPLVLLCYQRIATSAFADDDGAAFRVLFQSDSHPLIPSSNA